MELCYNLKAPTRPRQHAWPGDDKKTREQLADELAAMRARIAGLEHTQRTLCETNIQLQAMYDAASVIILAHDVHFDVVYMNPYACRVLGYEEGEMIGQPIARLIGEWGEAERGGDVRSQVTIDPQAQVQGFEQYYRKKHGGCVLIRWNVTALQDAEGQVIGVLGVGQDVTEQARTREQTRAHRQHLKELVKERTERLIEINEQLHHEMAERKRAERERESPHLRKLQEHPRRPRLLAPGRRLHPGTRRRRV
jgi:PAS domain S-box-containing protein